MGIPSRLGASGGEEWGGRCLWGDIGISGAIMWEVKVTGEVW